MKTIRDQNFQGKRVLLRCDFNAPLDENGNVIDDFRIQQSLPTITHLLEQGAKLFLISHLGSPKGKVQDSLSLNPIRKVLEKYLNQPVAEVSFKEAEKFEGSVALLENIRFNPGEEENDESFAKELASLGDAFVNDAFSASHRSHASIVSLPKFLPSYAGLLLEKEVLALEHFLKHPAHPFVAVVGGKKVEDKLSFVDAISNLADFVLIGNLLAQEIAKKGTVLKNPKKIVLPLDGYPGDGKELDIGPRTRTLFAEKIKDAKSVFWAGPLGLIEKKEYAAGSLEVAKAIIGSFAFSVAGGGNLSAFLGEYNLRDKFSYVSTGGGATLAFLAGKKLPGLEALGYYAD